MLSRFFPAVMLSLLLTSTAFAQTRHENRLTDPEKNERLAKPLNLKTVRILSLLPVNAPAFIYARKPGRGVLLTLVQGLGLAAAIPFGINLATEDCYTGSIFDGFCSILYATFGVTVAMWAAPYIYTAIDAPKVAEEYNNSLARRRKVTLVPLLAATSNGGIVGVAAQF
jgi:hypothetical protein